MNILHFKAYQSPYKEPIGQNTKMGHNFVNSNIWPYTQSDS